MTDQQGRFVWYELMAHDTEAAKAFYTKVVGWSTQDASVPGMAYTMFTDGPAGGRPEDGRAAELDRIRRGE
jgi:predicted enzyme related to lactoylglutathione lyase